MQKKEALFGFNHSLNEKQKAIPFEYCFWLILVHKFGRVYCNVPSDLYFIIKLSFSPTLENNNEFEPNGLIFAFIP